MKIIIVLEKYGGFCNRLFQSSHYHAYSMDKGIKFFNISMVGLLRFDNHYFYFLDKLNNFFLKYLYRFLKLFFRKNKICFYLNKENYIKIVGGWKFRKYNLISKYYEKLNIIYSFKKKNLSEKKLNLIIFLKDLKNQGKFLVGIHIRRKDYKSWNSGKYYFEKDFYKKVLNELKIKLIKENHDPFIFSLSDEQPSKVIGADFESNGSWKEDQIILQTCDLIVGPPSTFTMWASFISKTPLIQLNSEENYDLEKRFICEG